MIIPAVMFIEMALDMLKDSPNDGELLAHEMREFRMLGDARLKTLDEIPQSPGSMHYTDVELGYLLGLETARALLATMPAAVNVHL